MNVKDGPMPTEFWIYGGLMVSAGILVWRVAMQYYTYLEDAYNHSDSTRHQLRMYLRGTDSHANGNPLTGSPISTTPGAVDPSKAPSAANQQQDP